MLLCFEKIGVSASGQDHGVLNALSWSNWRGFFLGNWNFRSDVSSTKVPLALAFRDRQAHCVKAQ